MDMLDLMMAHDASAVIERIKQFKRELGHEQRYEEVKQPDSEV